MRSILALLCITLFSFSTPETYVVDTHASSLDWSGYYLFSFGEHAGTVQLTEGKLAIENSEITGGSFTIDMTSITCTDMPADDGGNDLVNHLQSDDFFSTAKFPEAKFEITKVEPIKDSQAGQPNVEITGTLTLKGVKNALTFPALVSVEPDGHGRTWCPRGARRRVL